MHIVHLIQRRFPNQASRIVAVFVLVSASALLLGLGVLILQTTSR